MFRENKSLIVKPSRNGKGIYTKRLFAPEDVVFQITGPRVTGDIDEDIDDIIRANAIRFDENTYISPQGRIADFLNHSCNPNAKVVKKGGKLFVVAIRTIPQNREVLIDYATITAVDDIWKMQCNCGSTMCRGMIASTKKLPATLRQSYIERGIIPPYILAIR